MTKRTALLLVVAATSCTTDLSVRRKDGTGRVTGEADIESGTVHAIFASPGETGRAYHDVVHADTLETVCKADPSSAACVVGMANDPQAAAYILRRGYSRPFGDSARVHPLAGAPARLAVAADGLDSGPDTVRMQPPVVSKPRAREPSTGAGAHVAHREERSPRPPLVKDKLVRTPASAAPQRCAEARSIMGRALSEFRLASAARARIKSGTPAAEVIRVRGEIKERLARADRELDGGLNSCRSDATALRDIRALRAGIPRLREEWGINEEGSS